MAARFPYYLLADSPEGRKKQSRADRHARADPTRAGPARDMHKGFVYRTVPHVTLKSIANNPDITEGMTREQIDAAIARHADTETLYDQPYEDKDDRPADRAVHRREPVAAPEPARRPSDRGGADATAARRPAATSAR